MRQYRAVTHFRPVMDDSDPKSARSFPPFTLTLFSWRRTHPDEQVVHCESVWDSNISIRTKGVESCH